MVNRAFSDIKSNVEFIAELGGFIWKEKLEKYQQERNKLVNAGNEEDKESGDVLIPLSRDHALFSTEIYSEIQNLVEKSSRFISTSSIKTVELKQKEILIGFF